MVEGGARGIAQQLRGLVLAEKSGLVPTRYLRPTFSRELKAPLWLYQELGTHVVYVHTRRKNTYSHKKK